MQENNITPQKTGAPTSDDRAPELGTVANPRLDLSRQLRFYMSKLRQILICVVCFMTLGTIYLVRKQARFLIESNVLITDNDKESNLMRTAGLGDLLDTKASVDNEVEVFNSFYLFRHVVDSLQLNKSYVQTKYLIKPIDFFASTTPIELICAPELPDTLTYPVTFSVKVNEEGLATKVTVRGGEKNKKILHLKNKKFPISLHTGWGDFILAQTHNYIPGEDLKMKITLRNYDSAAEQLRKDIKATVSSKKADVMTVSYKSTNKAQGKRVVDAAVNTYNALCVNRDILKSRRIGNFIDRRLIEISSELTDDESSIEDYMQHQGLTDLEGDVSYNMGVKARLEPTLMQAKTDLEILEMTKHTLADNDNPDALLPTTMSMEAVAGPIKEYNERVLWRMRIRTQAKGENATLASLTKTIDALRENINSSLDRTIAATRLQIQEMQSKLSSTKGDLRSTPKLVRAVRNLERQRGITEQVFLFLLKEREQTNMRISNALPKGVVIDRAYAYGEPTGMGTKFFLCFFFLVGVGAMPAYYYAANFGRQLLGRKPKHYF